MSSHPSGTVTFMFTDIEGSTKLAQSLGDQWESLRARHHETLKEAIEANHGYVFQIIGDAFCVAFHNAEDAFKSAVQSQTDLQADDWGDSPIKVRMGIHTGKADVQEDGQYQGYLALSLVQRIMSCGHGNQTLLSGATENLLRGTLPDDIDLLDLGRHNFKGVPQAVRVFQVNSPDLQRDFPPLRTFDILPNNLPSQLTSFVGREKELADVKRLLSDTHMLTLIGPGGTGKTRLSIQAANNVLNLYPDGVWLVDLAPILDPLLVPRTTAITIGLRNEPQRPVIDMLCDYLAKKKMLIILDNCEHLVDACAQMADRIMHAASDVQILASSREALGIAGEVTYRVPSLGLPDVDNLPSLETLSQYEAVKLFIDRATAAIPDFKVTNEHAPALAQICHRLDGIPLAIELAAGKIRVLGLEQIAKRLDDCFKLLTGGSRTAMERHQTLRATVDWSYNLLPSEEQTLFRRLAVFLGGWTLEAAESVCGDEPGSGSVGSDDVLNLLEQLINKSLVITDDKDGTSRYRALETIRQYANEKLVDSGESESLREKHLAFFLNLAEIAEPHLYRHEQLEWLVQLDADHENLRAALEYASGAESAEPSLRLCAALGMFWSIKGYYLEGTKRLATALEKLANDDDPEEVTARVRTLVMDTEIAWHLDDAERIRKSAEMCLELAQKSGAELEAGIATYRLGFYWIIRNFQKSRSLLEQSINTFQKLNAVYWEAKANQTLEFCLVQSGEKKNDLHYLKRTEELARQAGERWHLAWVLSLRSEELARFGQIQEGEILAKEADMYYRQVGSAFNNSTRTYAAIAWIKSDYEQAESLLLEQREQYSLLGEKIQKTNSTLWLGQLSLDQGNIQKARGYFEEVLETGRKGFAVFTIPIALAWLCNPIFGDGDEKKFRELVREGVHLARSLWFGGKMNFLAHMLEAFHTYDPHGTALILGTLKTAIKESMVGPIWPWNKRLLDRAEAHCREVLGDEGFESAFEEGLKLSLDDALDLVLKSVDEE